MKKRDTYEQILEFNTRRIVVYLVCELSFHDIPVALVDIHPLSCEHEIFELLKDHSEGHAESHLPFIT